MGTELSGSPPFSVYHGSSWLGAENHAHACCSSPTPYNKGSVGVWRERHHVNNFQNSTLCQTLGDNTIIIIATISIAGGYRPFSTCKTRCWTFLHTACAYFLNGPKKPSFNIATSHLQTPSVRNWITSDACLSRPLAIIETVPISGMTQSRPD